VPSFSLSKIIITEGYIVKNITNEYNATCNKDAVRIGCNKTPWSKVIELYEVGKFLGYID
jgi:hypothetical protein